MEYVSIFLQDQVGDTCYAGIQDKGLLNSGCSLLVLSKLVGLIIIGLSLMVKLPQILLVVNSGSADGLNLSSLLIETFSINIIVAVCYLNQQGFTTYGDSIFVLVQNMALILIVLHYLKRTDQQIFFVAGAAAFNYMLFCRLSKEVVGTMILGLFPLMIMGSFPQLWQNYTKKSCGNLSSSTVIISFACAIGRVFTNKVEVDDPIANFGSGLGAVINTIMVVQVFSYADSAVKPEAETEKKQN
ncbi:hypothetical protein DSO57_1026892 [Entomophthora muscae]|uniref:Uncharacterized protein n=1 Tax=Entomophthora muscae TaxID=34485 RepID=A0ACC2TD67_9FUNG|nr:hypothetical protein DSO57_1026892 [Entomophthora muscae]